MGGAVAVEEGPHGQLIAVKRPVGGQSCDAFRREAAILDLARLPGVVALADPEARGDLTELRTTLVSQRTLARPGRLSAVEQTRIAAGLATTLADLHRIGVSHGGLVADNVLLDRAGVPVLCGFSSAGLRYAIGDYPAGGFNPATDITALGTLLAELSSEAGPPLPWQGGYLRNRAARNGLRQMNERLLRHATTAVNLDAVAAELARYGAPSRANQRTTPSVNESVLTNPTRELPRRAVSRPTAAVDNAHVTTSSNRRRVGLLFAVASLAVLGGIGTVALLHTFQGHTVPVASVPGGTVPGGTVPDEIVVGDATTASDPLPPNAATTSRPNRACPTTTSELLTGGLPTNCVDAVKVSANRLIVLGTTFELGSPADRTVLADEDCDGLAEVSLLERSTGRVFLYDTWPTVGQDLSASRMFMAPDAQTIQATESNGCLRLQAVRADGTITALQVPTS